MSITRNFLGRSQRHKQSQWHIRKNFRNHYARLCFPKTKLKIKSNNKANLWITKGIAKSSKRRQKLYEKFLKNRSIESENIYKHYRKLFETMKSKRKYYSEKLLLYQGDAKKHCELGKKRSENLNLFTQTYHAKLTLIKMLSLRKRQLWTHSTIFSLILVQN